MELFDQTIAEFGRRLGIDSLAPGASGTVDLSIEQVGRLQIEELEEVALVTLARPWPEHASKTAQAALALCHWRENHPWAINAGSLKSAAQGTELLLFTARCPLRAFDVPALDRMLGYLSNLMDAAEKAG